MCMWMLLGILAMAGAVLSFSSFTQLAEACVFPPRLAPLLPVTVDAGAAAGCLAWLSAVNDAESRSYRCTRALTIVLLDASVAGNATVHGLAAYQLAAPWPLVVAVSAVAPAVLGAVVHLAVLVGRGGQTARFDTGHVPSGPADSQDSGQNIPLDDHVAELIERRVGRRRLAAELGITEHQARQLLAARNGHGG